jgi:hypothetical protein
MIGRAALVLGFVLAVTPIARASVPTTVNFSARLVDDRTGEEITGTRHLAFELYDTATGGTALWSEGRDVEVEDGLVFVEIGETRALEPALFDGRRLFLQVIVGETAMEPRIALSSVPYALRSAVATEAETVGGLSAQDLQHRITGTCGTGNFIIGVNEDGSVACAPDLSGSGDITDVIAGSGLQGGGTAGSVTLSLINCAPNEVLKFNGSVWACAADANSGGDITAVNIGPGGGLVGGGASGDVTLSLLTTCGVGQLLKWNGSSWGCANDIDTDTNSGGTITGITTSGTSGLVGGAAAGNVVLSLLTSCAPNQLLKWNGTAWACANDIDTNSGGTITNVVAGAGLSGGGSSGSVTLAVGAGPGISVAATTVSLDTVFTDNRYDPRYINASGDAMTGALDMAQQRLLNRGCRPGYVRHAPGLCLEDIDASGLTFSLCARRCANAGTHLCSSAELRAAMQSGITIGNGGVIGDWIDDQVGTANALVIASNTDTNAMSSVAVTNTQFCRCCENVE